MKPQSIDALVAEVDSLRAQLAAKEADLVKIVQDMRSRAADDAFDDGPIAAHVIRWADALAALQSQGRS